MNAQKLSFDEKMKKLVYESYKMSFTASHIREHRKVIQSALIALIHESELTNIELREPAFELIRMLEFVQHIEDNIE